MQPVDADVFWKAVDVALKSRRLTLRHRHVSRSRHDVHSACIIIISSSSVNIIVMIYIFIHRNIIAITTYKIPQIYSSQTINPSNLCLVVCNTDVMVTA